MNKITQKKINLDLVLKDVEKYCFSELSFEKIKNLEYITNFDKLVEVHYVLRISQLFIKE